MQVRGFCEQIFIAIVGRKLDCDFSTIERLKYQEAIIKYEESLHHELADDESNRYRGVKGAAR